MVNMPKPILCTSSKATELLLEYNQLPIVDFDPLRIQNLLGNEKLTVYTSSMSRAIQTARILFPEADSLYSVPLFNEYELSMIAVPILPLPYKAWTTLSRFFWFTLLNNKGESRFRATQRMKKATDQLVQFALKDQQVVLIAHGYLIAEMRRELEKRGWQIIFNEGNKNLSVTKLVYQTKPTNKE